MRYIESAIALSHRDDGVVEIRRCNVHGLGGEEIVDVWTFEADQYEVDVLLA